MDQVYTNEKEMMNIIMRRNEDLLVEEAVKFLKSNSTPTIAVPPTLPKAGEVYVFKADKPGASSGKLIVLLSGIDLNACHSVANLSKHNIKLICVVLCKYQLYNLFVV